MTNLETIQCLYKAFAARDREVLLAILHPEMEWIQNDGFPNGGVHKWVPHILDDVLGQFPRDWEGFRPDVKEWLDAGDQVIALGEYRGRYRATDRDLRAAFAHVYTLRDGRVIRFRQFTDTVMFDRAMKSTG